MRSCLFGGIALSVVALAGVPSNAAVVEVNVFDFDYSVNPELHPIIDAVINVGDTVSWRWVKGNHSVTSVLGQAEQFDSGIVLTLDHVFEHTFTNAGTFWYFCRVNGSDNLDGTASGMSGTVTVNAIPTPGTAALCGAGMFTLVFRRRR